MVFEITPEIINQAIYSAVLIASAVVIYKLISRSISRFAKRTSIDRHTTKPIEKLVLIITGVVALLALMGIWGLNAPLGALLTGAGFAGIVIGLATKDIFSDLLSGIMLFFDRPFKIGELIYMNDIRGRVRDIGLRSTKIKTTDGLFLTVPNSVVASSIITNPSRYKGRRLKAVIGVDYDTDLKKAKKAIEKSIRSLQKKGMLLEDPKEKVVIQELGSSSIDFMAYFWYNPKYAKDNDLWFREIKSELIQEVKKEFDAKGITIPFPQVTLSERKKRKV